MIIWFCCLLIIDINECASHPCENLAVCYHHVDSYSCQCVDGYTGVNCETGTDFLRLFTILLAR